MEPFLDTGVTAWMLVSASFVLLMTPGLALFYGGMTRSKSILNMMMMCFGAMAVVGCIYVLWGWSMSYGESLGGIVGNPFDQFGLGGSFDPVSILNEETGAYMPTIVDVGFQATFAIITVALIAGSIADRTKYATWLVFAGLWATLSYFPMSHMVWGDGLLSGAGPFASIAEPIDFAGGTVVHINAGVAGLVLALVIGKRKGWPGEAFKPHNLPLVMLGAALLWFGWFGFNAGSAYGADEVAGLAWVNTTTATGGAILGWLLVEKLKYGKATSLGAASGVVAGLVAITPAAGALTPVTSIVLGALAGVASAFAVSLKTRFGYDDSLDVVGVHLVSGLVGTVLIGLLATDTGLFFGGGIGQLVVQIIIAVIAIVFSGVVTLVIALVLKATMGWRIPEEDEVTGIDQTAHAERAYEGIA
ncbi:ammonium transporter [Actinotalea caeni]|uniref:ammonium transporter n=1 Tax=Actinotalea caeni TaxID=1348467 RepID=UPI0012E0DA24|nr:ammonium transporter [Actinotalea caeni]